MHRRYALSTLVGIEDDLDAPDLGPLPKAGIEPNPRPAPSPPNNSQGRGSSSEFVTQIRTNIHEALDKMTIH